MKRNHLNAGLMPLCWFPSYHIIQDKARAYGKGNTTNMNRTNKAIRRSIFLRGLGATMLAYLATAALGRILVMFRKRMSE